MYLNTKNGLFVFQSIYSLRHVEIVYSAADSADGLYYYIDPSCREQKELRQYNHNIISNSFIKNTTDWCKIQDDNFETHFFSFVGIHSLILTL